MFQALSTARVWRVMDLIASGAPAPTWLGYMIDSIELFGGLAILIGLKTRWVACAIVVWVIIVTAARPPFLDNRRCGARGQSGEFL